MDKLKEPTLSEITSSLTSRYQLNFTVQDVASLWFLCKQVQFQSPISCLGKLFLFLAYLIFDRLSHAGSFFAGHH